MLTAALGHPISRFFMGLHLQALQTALVDCVPNSTPYRLRGLCWEEWRWALGQVCLTTALKPLLPFSRALPDVHAPDLVLVTSWEEERTYDHRLSSQMRKQRYAKDRWLVLHWGLRTWSPAVWVLESIQLRPWNLEVTVEGQVQILVLLSTLHSLWQWIYLSCCFLFSPRETVLQALSLEVSDDELGWGEDKVRWMPTQRWLFSSRRRSSLNSATIQAVTQSSNSKCLLWFKCWGTRMDKMWSLHSDLSVGVWESIGCVVPTLHLDR